MESICENRKAYFNYFILDKFDAGIELFGCEVKSIREHKCSIAESYITIINNEAWIKKMQISKFKNDTNENYDEKRDRKLLLTKSQISKLKEESNRKGLTIIPLSVYFRKGFVKVALAVCKGKHTYDKRETIKNRDIERQTKREILKIK